MTTKTSALREQIESYLREHGWYTADNVPALVEGKDDVSHYAERWTKDEFLNWWKSPRDEENPLPAWRQVRHVTLREAIVEQIEDEEDG